jgi:hypothetical protein
MNGNTPFLQGLSDDVCGPMLFVTQFRMGVDIPADGLNFGLPIQKGLKKFHANHFREQCLTVLSMKMTFCTHNLNWR